MFPSYCQLLRIYLYGNTERMFGFFYLTVSARKKEIEEIVYLLQLQNAGAHLAVLQACTMYLVTVCIHTAA